MAATVPVQSFYGPIHVAINWPGSPQAGVDLDISACAYNEAGNQAGLILPPPFRSERVHR